MLELTQSLELLGETFPFVTRRQGTWVYGRTRGNRGRIGRYLN